MSKEKINGIKCSNPDCKFMFPKNRKYNIVCPECGTLERQCFKPDCGYIFAYDEKTNVCHECGIIHIPPK